MFYIPSPHACILKFLLVPFVGKISLSSLAIKLVCRRQRATGEEISTLQKTQEEMQKGFDDA